MNYAISHLVLFVLTINEDFLGILKKVKCKNWSSLRTP